MTAKEMDLAYLDNLREAVAKDIMKLEVDFYGRLAYPESHTPATIKVTTVEPSS
jgi:hypothetical protein